VADGGGDGLRLSAAARRPGERAVFLNTLWLYLIGVLGQGLAVLLDAAHFPGAALATYAVFRLPRRRWPSSASPASRCSASRCRSPPAAAAPDRGPRIIVAYVVFGFRAAAPRRPRPLQHRHHSAILTRCSPSPCRTRLGNMLGGIAIQLDNSVKWATGSAVDDLNGRVSTSLALDADRDAQTGRRWSSQ